jgi:tRNA-splicing ligase RtcB
LSFRPPFFFSFIEFYRQKAVCFAYKAMSTKLNNHELKAIGIKEPEILKAVGMMAKNLVKSGELSKQDLLDSLKQLLQTPEQFTNHPYFAELVPWATRFKAEQEAEQAAQSQAFSLKSEAVAYPVFGAEDIDPAALEQMNVAMRLPVAQAGALMPDAHVGYGLPIGGVLATQAHTIIPYAVGVDIACRMCLSVFDLPADYYFGKKDHQLKSALLDNTLFGIDGRFAKPNHDDEVFAKTEWNEIPLVKNLKHKAIQQLGTSGTGNHFVEWGVIEIHEKAQPALPLPAGRYLALLSHSGSRGFGASIANHYSKLAAERTRLPKEAKHLAWLDLRTEEGMEYWLAMNLAGDYASANHHQIHRRIAADLGSKPAFMLENHHNFAWKEQLADGTEVMVHRKGATPAAEGELGIIPGSMTAPGFVVSGKGYAPALASASHGAGRAMSRGAALRSIAKAEVKAALKEKGVTLIGGDLDEAPMAYKDIRRVMSFQEALVEVLAQFTPKIVRMADPDPKGRRED